MYSINFSLCIDLDEESLGMLAATAPGRHLTELHLCKAPAFLNSSETGSLTALLAACGPTLNRLVLDTVHSLDLQDIGHHCRLAALLSLLPARKMAIVCNH
jgi:hypothetical protein